MSFIAYIGPGLGGGIFAILCGLVISLFVAAFALVWYPLKRLFAGSGPGKIFPSHGKKRSLSRILLRLTIPLIAVTGLVAILFFYRRLLWLNTTHLMGIYLCLIAIAAWLFWPGRNWVAACNKAAIAYFAALFFFIWGLSSVTIGVFPGEQIYHVADVIRGVEGDGKTVVERLTGDPQILTRVRHSVLPLQSVSFSKLDTDFEDRGYILVSRYDENEDQSVIDLIAIHGFNRLHRWVPPIHELENGEVSADAIRFRHPILLPDGDIVITCTALGNVMRVDKDNRIVWNRSIRAHHSMELDQAGNIFACVTSKTPARIAGKDCENDGYVKISPAGDVLEEGYFLEALRADGFSETLLALSANHSSDATHLNDVQPVCMTRGLARKGDLMVSMRSISTVFLYRPETKEIVWRKTGPWTSQHDIDLLEDGTYSIFNNNNLQLMMREASEELKPGVVGINIYDPQSGEVLSPYDAILKSIDLRVETEGLCRVLPNGDVFLESPNEGALYRLSPDSVRWRYENLFEDARRVGTLGWSRYLHADEVNPASFSGSPVDALVEHVPAKTKSDDASILFIVCFSVAVGVIGGEIVRRFARAQLLSEVWQPIRLSLTAIKNSNLCDAQKQQMLLQYSREILIVCVKVMGFLVVLGITVISCTALFSIWDSQSYRQLYSIRFILLSSVIAAVWCWRRNRSHSTDYGFWSRLLHMLALRFAVAGRVTLDVNNLFAANRESAAQDREGHIFVSGLARSGTTLLMRRIYDSGNFCTLTYEDMPFVLAPAVWRRVRPRVHAGNALRERAHGDGIMVDTKSPEAFEEVFWRIRCGSRYLLADRLVPMTASTEEIESFRKYVDSIIMSDCLLRNQQNTRRYLSKNNNNILRIPSIADAFPHAIQLVPFRDPVQHTKSLMTQHERFLEINRHDPFTEKYMKWLGHYEFGSAHRPFRFDAKLEQMGTTTSPEYWLQMWNDVYLALIKSHSHNTLFFDYDAFCANPLPIWSSLCEKLDIPISCGLENIRGPNVARGAGDIHAPSTLLSEVQITYQQMKDMAVKPEVLRRSG